MTVEQQMLLKVSQTIKEYKSIKDYLLGLKNSSDKEQPEGVIKISNSFDTVVVHLKIDESEYLMDVLTLGKINNVLWNMLAGLFILDLSIEYINKI